MKFVQAAKNDIKRVVQEWKIIRSAGTSVIPTITNIGALIASADAKATLADTDIIAASDSAASDVLVGWSYANLKAQLLAYLTTAFNLLYQPLSTALSKITESGGLPLWDGGAWPGGGGGGGEWTEITRTVVSVGASSVDFLNVFTDSYDTYRVTAAGFHCSAAGRVLRMNVGYGVGPTWLSAGWNAHLNRSTSTGTAYVGQIFSNTGYVNLGTTMQNTASDMGFCALIFNNLRSATLYPQFATLHGEHANSIGPWAYKVDIVGLINDTTNKMDHLRFFFNADNVDGGTFIIEGKNA